MGRKGGEKRGETGDAGWGRGGGEWVAGWGGEIGQRFWVTIERGTALGRSNDVGKRTCLHPRRN